MQLSLCSCTLPSDKDVARHLNKLKYRLPTDDLCDLCKKFLSYPGKTFLFCCYHHLTMLYVMDAGNGSVVSEDENVKKLITDGETDIL